MDHFPSTNNARPWWAEVAHLRGDDSPAPAMASAPTRTVAQEAALLVDRLPAARERSAARTRSAASVAPRSRRRERTATDWFAQEARGEGRRTKARQDPSRPQRPRATLIDVAPEHAVVRRAPQVRRAPGERPTVTITGRPDAALPPQVAPQALRARRTREHATSLVASPDRMILWAVALGLLMILASIGTASADAAALLP